ncbi:peptide chain release factor N(5)-glutamine methyltransferase [Rhizobium sp.]|jgi:release factor glutamine methyltransferase|uniref:peptide chain release factor N(5)-glutamine methyltransferase n=1 Tax=Rhizobium sp. TaxID=391 RepID=UPI000E823237|nr:peptide chain release factor N(5)-glutamine methyltransferase [Rhizobium sp.]
MTDGLSLRDALLAARRQFSAATLDDAAGDARTLIAGLLHLSMTDMLVHDNRVLTHDEITLINSAVQRRLNHEPVHRILGHRAFYGLDLALSSATLEPRPDTEILVERLLPHLHSIVAAKGDARFLDMGTGTGAIALALLQECEGATALATDISNEALATASDNAARHGLQERFQTLRSDWYSAVTGRFDMIVSNPPYINSAVIDELSPEVRLFDPMAALDGGADGLDAYRAIAAGACAHLQPGGLVGLEIGYDQNETVTALFLAHGFTLVDASRDHGGQDRALIFRLDLPIST